MSVNVLALDYPKSKLLPYTNFNDKERINIRNLERKKKYIIFLRGIEKTPKWNAGIWFNPSRKDKVIDKIENNQAYKFKQNSNHRICPYCSKKLEEGDTIKAIKLDLKHLSKLNKNITSQNTHIVKNQLGRINIHNNCTNDLINIIEKRAYNSMANWLSQ
jgi:hypothetical protein